MLPICSWGQPPHFLCGAHDVGCLRSLTDHVAGAVPCKQSTHALIQAHTLRSPVRFHQHARADIASSHPGHVACGAVVDVVGREGAFLALQLDTGARTWAPLRIHGADSSVQPVFAPCSSSHHIAGNGMVTAEPSRRGRASIVGAERGRVLDVM